MYNQLIKGRLMTITRKHFILIFDRKEKRSSTSLIVKVKKTLKVIEDIFIFLFLWFFFLL